MRFIHVHGASDGRDIYINPQYIESFTVVGGKVMISTVGIENSSITISESMDEFVKILFGGGKER